MAIGRTFPESLQKALRSLEHGRLGLNCDPGEARSTALADDELLGGRRDRRRPSASSSSRRRCGAASRSTTLARRDAGSTRGSSTRCALIVEERAALGERRPAGMTRRGSGGGPSGSASPTPSSPTCGRVDEADVRAAARGGRRAADVQDRRHLRRRVRGRDAVPLLDLRGRGRGASVGPAAGRHPRLGPEPHRPGHRVRLLLRPRQLRPARRRLRDGDGQLQPGDGVDRLRHLRPALLRAAHRGGRAQRHRGRDRGGRRRASAGDRRPRRPDAAEAGRPAAPASWSPARAPSRSTSPRTARSGTRCAPSSHPAAARRHRGRPRARRWRSPTGVGFPVLVRPSYVLGGRAMQIVLRRAATWHGRHGRSSAGLRQPRPRGRPVGRAPGARSTASWRTPPRSTSTPSATPPARC